MGMGSVSYTHLDGYKRQVFADDDTVVGENAKAAVAAMNDGDVVLLQNTRFRKEETKNLEPFSSELASLAEVYVNDAFGSAHRAHCSTAGVTDHIKDTAVGYLMSKEIEFLGNAEMCIRDRHTSLACWAVAVLPVPMAHTGS